MRLISGGSRRAAPIAKPMTPSTTPTPIHCPLLAMPVLSDLDGATPPQFAQGRRRVGCSEDRRPRDEGIGPGAGRLGDRLDGDPPVHFEPDPAAVPVNQ